MRLVYIFFIIIIKLIAVEINDYDDRFDNTSIKDFLQIDDVNRESSTVKARSYILTDLCLSTVQYRYEDNEMNESMDLLKNGLYTQRFLETTMLDNTYLKPWPTITYTKNHTLTNITKLQVIITSDIGNYSPYFYVF